MLLDRGSDIEMKDHVGQTPLTFAAVHGQGSIVKLLLERAGLDATAAALAALLLNEKKKFCSRRTVIESHHPARGLRQ